MDYVAPILKTEGVSGLRHQHHTPIHVVTFNYFHFFKLSSVFTYQCRF